APHQREHLLVHRQRRVVGQFRLRGHAGLPAVRRGVRRRPCRSAAARRPGVAVFAADAGVRAVLDPDRSIDHWSEFASGGHFPAMEVPDLLVADVRAFLRTVRA
ncbi:MAG: hypothetical protein ACRDVZ_15520, partial [Jiangellaceae bacterium]